MLPLIPPQRTTFKNELACRSSRSRALSLAQLSRSASRQQDELNVYG